MDLLGLLKVFVRQWTITVPVLVLVIIAAVVVQSSTPTVYEASGSVVIAEPPADPSSDPANLTQPANVARQLRLTDEFRDLAQADGVSGVLIDGTGTAAIEISVSGAPAEAMEDAANSLAVLAADRVARVQDDAEIPEEERVEAVVQRVDLVPLGTETDAGAPTFTAVTEVFLDDPLADAENPLTASTSTARLFEVSSQSDASREQIEERAGADIDYEVVQDVNDRAPILEIFVTADSQEVAIEGFDHVADNIGEDLDDRQARAGVRSTDRLVVDVLAAPGEARDVSPPVSRTVAVLLALGILLAVALAVLAENLGWRWSGPPRPGSTAGETPWLGAEARADPERSSSTWSRATTAGEPRSGLNPPNG